VTPGRARGVGFEPESRVVASNLLRPEGALISKGLNRSRIACKAALRWFRFCAVAPDFAFWRLCFLDCWGAITPLSLSEAFSCFSWEGGMFWLDELACRVEGFFCSSKSDQKKIGSPPRPIAILPSASPHLIVSNYEHHGAFFGGWCPMALSW
jgi:hypothetical protein